MAPIPREAFVRRCRALDAAALAAFAAAVFAARGRETRAAGDVLVLGAGADARRLRAVPHGRGRGGGSGADGVVAGVVDPAAAVDAVALHRMVLYALDRETGAAVCRRHLDCELTGWTAPETTTATDRPRSRPLLAVAGGLLVVLAAVVAGGGLPAGEDDAPGPEGANGAAIPAWTTVAESPKATPTGPGSGAATRAATGAPPGLANGTVDAEAIAAAHARAIRERPYTWTVSVTEFYHGRRVSDRRAVVRVAGNATYVSDVSQEGIVRLRFGGPLIPNDPRYADGRTRYELTDARNGSEFVARTAADPGSDTFAAQATTLVTWYLSAAETSVRASEGTDGRRTYTVRASNETSRGVANATATAVVEEDGLVRRLYRRHEVVGTGLRVEVRFTYLSVGQADVTRPSWVADARVEWRGATGDAGGADWPTNRTAEG